MFEIRRSRQSIDVFLEPKISVVPKNTVSGNKRTFWDVVRTKRLKTGNPSAPGLDAAIICCCISFICFCRSYWPRICGGTLAFPFFISMLDPFWTTTTWEAGEVTRLRPPKDEAEDVAVHASTEQRATAAATIRNRVDGENIWLLVVAYLSDFIRMLLQSLKWEYFYRGEFRLSIVSSSRKRHTRGDRRWCDWLGDSQINRVSCFLAWAVWCRASKIDDVQEWIYSHVFPDVIAEYMYVDFVYSQNLSMNQSVNWVSYHRWKGMNINNPNSRFL